MTNLILCGGSGTRLWPLSRESRPKQFSQIFGAKSLFQETALRNCELASQFIVAVNVEQRHLALEQCQVLGDSPVLYLLEPTGRNTAPAIALSCFALDRDELVFVTPSDHRISNLEEYKRAVLLAVEHAKAGALVTFGIEPTYAETGYGYIEADGTDVKSFCEKPDVATAREYVESGRYLWNSGMLVFRAGTFLDELFKYQPLVYEACRAIGGLTPTREDMAAIPSISVDYAVMEKSKLVRVVACDPGWSDLGSFDALAEEVMADEAGNRVLGDTEPALIDSRDNFIVTSGRRIVAIGVSNLMIVDTNDALLLLPAGASPRLKEAVALVRTLQPELLK